MDIRQLQLFVAAADAGAFGRAAAREHISDSGLQKQVRRLESEIGLKLFESSGRNVKLTTVGRQVAEAARRVLREAERMNSELEAIRSGSGGIVELASRPLHAGQFLAAAARRFQDENPNCRAKLRIVVFDAADPGSSPLRSLLRNEVNLAVVENAPKRLDGIEVGSITLVAVMAEDHPLRNEPTVALEQISEGQLFAMPRFVWSRQCLDRLIDDEGVPVDIDVETPSPALLRMAQAGLGIAVVGDDNLPAGTPTYPALTGRDGQPIRTSCKVAWRWGAMLSPMEWKFVEFMQRKQRESGTWLPAGR